MPVSSPQLGLALTSTLLLSDIQQLKTSPFVVVPAASGFINIFVSASLSYSFDTTALSNVNQNLGFYLDTGSGLQLISNLFPAQGFLGVSYSNGVGLSSAVPYPSSMAVSSNKPIVLSVDGSNPTGGGTNAKIFVRTVYSVLNS